MAARGEARVVYAAGVVQGVALVTFPAASTIFTSPADYGLSSSEYGAMFLPQALTAITAALLGAGLTRGVGTKTLYLVGLGANLAAMTLLLASSTVSGETIAYPMLLVATTSLGVGFGLTVPVINTLTASLHPAKVDGSVLVLNALLGVGTAAAPVLVAAFDGLGAWWGLPLLVAVLLVGLILVSVPLPLSTTAAVPTPAPPSTRAAIPRRFWLFAAFALLYGICETMNGNWAQLDVTKELGESATVASIALTAFWASVTLGRVGFAALQRSFPTRRTFHVLPFVLSIAFVLVSQLPTGAPVLAVLAFALAGFGCSALLPLTITFGQEELVAISASVAGGVIAFYQMGYGIAAFGAGPLQSAGVDLSALFGFTGVVALALGVLSFVVRRARHGEPSSFHPRPPGAATPTPPPT